MRAITRAVYGGPEVLRVEELPMPAPEDGEVLVRVVAASVNPFDWHGMRGRPFVMRASQGLRAPRDRRLGADVAGVVEAVGSGVTRFSPGDEVFGMSIRTLAEFACVKEEGLVTKPANTSFAQAGVVGVAAMTALQGLRHAGAAAGSKVLINGASGGVGSFAVQLAKAAGAHVVGVTSTRNVEFVRGLGADDVVDYTETDPTSGGRYDAVLDLVGNRSIREWRGVLEAEGALVHGTVREGDWVAPLVLPVAGAVANRLGSVRVVSFLAHRTRADLMELAGHLESGRVVPSIEREYALDEVPDAIRQLETHRVRGKLAILVAPVP
jgi:NADPH:quinone reductase-like Zn-dependent oxidoreductase